MLVYFGTEKYAPVAQPDRVFGYEPKGQGFESLLARHEKSTCFKQVLFSTKSVLADGMNPSSKDEILLRRDKRTDLISSALSRFH